jgi:dipeptidyl aminopeptidase/acylaminoacyl peptidase
MHKLKIILFSLVTSWSFFSTPTWAQVAGIAPDQLRAMVEEGEYTFSHDRENLATEGIRREVYRFKVDDLLQYALVLWPAGEPPDKGWPIVQFNHGYHSDPPRNGFIGEKSDRPGEYYRETVQAFARAGYVVVAPDFRGHNISQGSEFTARVLADAWYSRDAIACFLALESLPDLDLERTYMLGHSMGGPITLRALLALGERVRAGAVWSSAGTSKISYIMGEALKSSDGEDSSELSKATMDALAHELQDLTRGVTEKNVSPKAQASQLQVPLSIQHSRDDRSTPVTNSLELAGRLYIAGRSYQLKVHPGDEHLFAGEMFTAAVARDIQWFQRHR